MVLEATKRRLTLYAVHRTGTCRGPSTPPHKAKRPKLSHSHRWASRSPQEAFESDSNLNHLRNGNANDMFYTECPTASGSQEFISGCGLCDLKNSSHDMFCHSCHAPKFAFHCECLRKKYEWSTEKIKVQSQGYFVCPHCERRMNNWCRFHMKWEHLFQIMVYIFSNICALSVVLVSPMCPPWNLDREYRFGGLWDNFRSNIEC